MIAWTSRLLLKPTMRESHGVTQDILVNHRARSQVQYCVYAVKTCRVPDRGAC